MKNKTIITYRIPALEENDFLEWNEEINFCIDNRIKLKYIWYGDETIYVWVYPRTDEKINLIFLRHADAIIIKNSK